LLLLLLLLLSATVAAVQTPVPHCQLLHSAMGPLRSRLL
jgi:hypothetical protein